MSVGIGARGVRSILLCSVFRAHYLAANGKPSHAVQRLVDCISLINPCLSLPHSATAYTHAHTHTNPALLLIQHGAEMMFRV